MKLFKSLLVAPATLGLLAPIAATANEVTINDFNPTEELAITNSRVDGLEARLNNFEAGSFSETTTASFGLDMMLGALDTDDSADNDSVMAGYSNKREDRDELTQYEAYYSYPVNDSMTITPLIYTQDAAGDLDDTTGMMVKTSFVF